jgi:hypothetical protein
VGPREEIIDEAREILGRNVPFAYQPERPFSGLRCANIVQ